MFPTLSMTSLVAALSDFVFIVPSERRCNLQTLVEMPWKELIGKDLARLRPDGYARDILRCTLHVGKTSFICAESTEDEKLSLQDIDNEMLSMINALPNCPLAMTTAGVHLIRYLIQDLLTANLFVLDPEFPTIYNRQTYEPNGQLLFPLKETKGSKESSFSLSCRDSTLIVRGVQYWQVANATNPTIINGYDALRIEVTIDLENAAQETLLHHFESASCFLQFHGFRRTLAEIGF